jgi:hypothetical protein
MKFLIAIAFLMAGFGSCSKAQATGLADLKFGQAQIADSQWNVQACTQTATCQIYSTNPGTAYKIPWTSGQIQWAPGDYIQFQPYTKDANNPWLAVQYGANGVGKTNMGLGHIINMGNDYFFFVGSDNNTGQLFSMTSGLSGSAGVTWTGTLNPTTAQVDAYAANGSTTPLAAGQTAGPPPLCCGGVAGGAITTDVNFFNSVNAFNNRTTNDVQVYIEQIGSNNNITVDQSGTINNKVKYNGNGNDNNISIRQSSTSPTALNYTDLTVNGNSNTVNILQQSTGGFKGINAKVYDNNNSLAIQQKDNGNHLVEVNLSGGNKNVDVLQEGAGNQTAKIGLTGMPVDLSLSQSGSASQTYSIQFNCATSGGCPKIVVQQGR